MGKYRISKHKDEIITQIIKNLIWIPIAALIPFTWNIINFIYNNIKTSKYITSENIIGVISVLLSVFALIVTIIQYKNFLTEIKNKKMKMIRIKMKKPIIMLLHQ